MLSIFRKVGPWQVMRLGPRGRDTMWLGIEKGKQHRPRETARPKCRRQDRDKEE